jgi:small GTP-binding protein
MSRNYIDKKENFTKPRVLKIITTGEGGVGKTTLLHRYVEGKFLVDTKMTLGVEFFLKEIDLDGNKILLQIWDFGGQDRFRFLLKNYVLGAKGALLLFDLTRPITLEKLEQWVKLCRTENLDLPILLLGSKVDLVNLITINEAYILEIKEYYEMFDYLRISSKTGENTDLAFELLAKEIIRKVENKKSK